VLKSKEKFEKLVKQIFRFGLVGGTAFLIDYGILFCLTEFAGVNYLLSGTISFSVSVVFNYLSSRFWVFEVKENANKVWEFMIFLILSVIGLGINQIIMYIGVDKFGIYYMLTKIIATFIVMVYNFVTRKMFME
jgi:putative flippase GtrA